MKTTTKPTNQQEEKMLKIEREARRGKQKWLFIMLGIMAVVIAAAVLVSVVGGLQYATYAFIAAIILLAITAKLCVAQMGKVLERQHSEKQKLDGDGSFGGFHL